MFINHENSRQYYFLIKTNITKDQQYFECNWFVTNFLNKWSHCNNWNKHCNILNEINLVQIF